jgi:subtilisin family serine protease
MKSAEKSTEELIAELEKNPAVENASPNHRVYALDTTPNDPRYLDGGLWGLRKIRAPQAWDTTTGSNNVYVAVIDSGITPNHADLAANFDASRSRNFTSGSIADYTDENGHGTHVSGTIAAVGNNGVGVTGVNWKAKIIALKTLKSDGVGYDSWIVSALEYLLGLLQTNPNLVLPAINLSLGGWQAENPLQTQQSALWRAFKAIDQTDRAAIVVAAGNEHSQVGAPATRTLLNGSNVVYRTGWYCYPASFTGLNNLIVVGAVDVSDKGATTTNWSSEAVHVAAPGVSILSAWGNGYAAKSGTSMAVPHVTGAIALLASAPSSLPPTASLLKELLCVNANSRINPPAPATANNIPIAPHGVPDTTVSKYGLIDIKAAMDAMNHVTEATSVTIEPLGSDGQNEFNLKVNETIRFSATVEPPDATISRVIWSSSNAYATVDPTGLVKGVSGGTAVITAKAVGGRDVSAQVAVTVTGTTITGTEPGPGPGISSQPSPQGGGGGGCDLGSRVSVVAALLLSLLALVARSSGKRQ